MDTPKFEIETATERVSEARRSDLLATPGFGRLFTEHMVQVRWSEARGWHSPRVCPYQALSLQPSESVLHYGQSIFEGLKAYRRPDGHVVTYRIDDHARRFQSSGRRMAMPELPVELFIEGVHSLIRQDVAWVPHQPGHTLYIRPTMIGTEPFLGVKPAASYLFFVIASPSGDYFPNGVQPVSVWVERTYVRASPGGTGAAKAAGNYGASLLAQQHANKQGCEQVVWLDARERRYVEELGGMNLFFVFGRGDETRIVTPALGDTILGGITRSSILQLARDRNIPVEERSVLLQEWIDGVDSDQLSEVFACGTAAVITPVGTLKTESGEWKVNGGETGPVATSLREQLLGIQYGSVEDPHGWTQTVT